MSISRRGFVAGAAALTVGRLSTPTSIPPPVQQSDRFDPWLEIDREALRHNTGEVSRLTHGRPILAVVKNNAYGLGLTTAGPLLEQLEEIAGFAVVKASAALALRDAGIRKPVLLMGMASPAESEELIARDVQLSLYTDEAEARLERLARRAGRPVDAHLYVDTGMGRMGMPYHRAESWLARVTARTDVRIKGCFMAFTEEAEFDREQLDRFVTLVERAQAAGVPLGQLHAASSNGVFHLPEAHLDVVRPGIALYGGYPSHPEVERTLAALRPAVRLRARVVRVAHLREGDSVSYGRTYVATKPTWTATLPVGHADGYPRRAVNGARVLINGAVYPVVGAVSASHTIVELGDDPAVRVGDVATLIGPDHPDIMPNRVADATGVSVYDLFMHLNPELPRFVGAEG